ncbi:MAG: T9SS type A sorting domain-containing protein [Paludibacter sp.]|nr:T9SS type A sorting domain-containing protein [Paludibacter sp.]
MRKLNKFWSLIAVMCLSTMLLCAQDWKMGKATLMTAFAAKVDTANVLGEYPRPQMVREKWMNLNGIWQFQQGTGFTQVPPIGKLTSKILVPFPVESAISGVMKHYDNLLYRRTFTIPTAWAGQRILVHFGAVDYKSQIYVNGQTIGIHTGGYDPFTYDITSALKISGTQEITVKVYDPTNNGGQPRGKQTLAPGDITYTPTTGIWQSVWLEPVPMNSISEIKIVPELDNSSVVINATTLGSATNLTVNIAVKDGDKTVANFSGNANSDLRISIPNPKLWSPTSPFLYDLKITLMSGDTLIDSLSSYFGMRKISLKQIGGVQKLMLNNEFLFQFGPLDQGFWPDGVYTAPTDSAMLFDIQKTKDFGFNMIRKHIKVEPYRWYYYADKLGLLVWQDMPSSNSYTSTPQTIDKVQFKTELTKMVQTHWNSPSIIMWVIFNEEQGQHDTETLVASVMSLDSTRMVNENSGAVWKDVGHIKDVHSYPQPGYPVSTTKALACGEYGSVGLSVVDHLWGTGVSMVMKNTGDEVLATYKDYADMLAKFKLENGLSAAVFTQITDVEREVNGLFTYDRAVCKVNETKLAEINNNLIYKNLAINNVLPTSLANGRTWKYVTTQPLAGWAAPTFNDAVWKSALGGFGSSGTPGGTIRTSWTTGDIWMRQTFTVGTLSASEIDNLELYIHHDEDCEVYINGVLASSLTGYTSTYNYFPINVAAKNALIINGTNVIAVHCHQTGGGQYIDAGILIRGYEVPSSTAIPTVKSEGKCKVYPNPAKNRLSVLRENPNTELIGIYNTVGRELIKPNKFDSQVDISSLNPGMYFMRTETDRTFQTISFVKI